ncbi:MAG TPA: SWIM zinc finger family protein [Atopostipes sp.]|nr:SWIM zinc finger family protein [Atopostipes sp.]
MNWRQHFQEHILDRGFDYYRQRLVTIEEYSKDYISAAVQGTEIYHVEIELEEQAPKTIFCDCPHAAEGNFCKHAAAVLYAFEIQRVIDANRSDTGEDISQLVREADEEIVRRFLAQVLEENEYLLTRFKGELGQEITANEFHRFKKDISEMFYVYSDSSGFINYYEAMELDTDLSVFIENTIENHLLKNGYYKETFELTKIICKELSETMIDDSGGIIVNITSECEDIWHVILTDGDTEVKRDMFQWFKTQIDGSLNDYIKERMEESLFMHFTEQEFLEDKASFAKERFAYYKNQKNSWSSSYEAQKWAMKYLKVLKSQNAYEELETFCLDYIHYPEVREFYADQLITQKNYAKAIQVLEEGKGSNMNKKSSLSREARIKLKDLYLEAGKTENYRNELWQLMNNMHAIDNDVYQEYKALFTETEWEDQRLSILENLSNLYGIDKILYEEKLYEKLLNYVVNSPNFSYLQTYENELVELFPNEVFDRYEKEILELSEVAGPRKKYRRIVSLIKRLRKLPSSEERVQEIVLHLREKYNNRPAMLEELRLL